MTIKELEERLKALEERLKALEGRLEDIAERVETLTSVFLSAQGVLTFIKWLAAVGASIAAILGLMWNHRS